MNSMHYYWAIIIFAVVDCEFYRRSPYPKRASSFWYKLPGGGIVAYIKFWRNSK